MLKMSQINYIKRLREKEGCSISEIAERVDINWRTAKKYADGDIDLQNEGRQTRSKPVMGPYLSILEAWIEEDFRAPKKQRRTAKAHYEQLKKYTDFAGSARTVRYYVRKIKKRLKNEREEHYVKLNHAPGTAQADFGEFVGIDPDIGKKTKYKFLVLTFPHSNGHLCRVLPSENAECFLEALKSMFEEIGGVPTAIWFDNLTTAVSDILEDGDRNLTGAFKEFQWHYRFKAIFCNPGRGHEKGHVEKKVGYIKNNWFSPPPVIDDIQEYNAELRPKMKDDRDRKHYSKDRLISELWQEDKDKLLVLPSDSKEVFRTKIATANKYGEVKVKGNTYHVPQAQHRQKLLLKIYWHKILVLDEHGEEQITSFPRKYNMDLEEIDWQGEFSIYRDKPRALEHAAYLEPLPGNVREYLLPESLQERKNRIEILLDLLDDYTINEIDQALDKALKQEHLEIDYLEALLANQPEESSQADSWTPDKVAEWRPPLKEYNELCREVISP